MNSAGAPNTSLSYITRPSSPCPTSQNQICHYFTIASVAARVHGVIRGMRHPHREITTVKNTPRVFW